MALIYRFKAEVESMSLSSLQNYTKLIQEAIKNKSILDQKLSRYSIKTLRNTVVKAKRIKKPNKVASRAFILKLLTTLTSRELKELEQYASTRLERLCINEFIEQLEKEVTR